MRGAVEVADGVPVVRLGPFALPLNPGRNTLESGRPVIVGIRPEAMQLGSGGAGEIGAVTAFVEDLGATLLVHLDSPEVDVVSPNVAEDDIDLNTVRPRLRAVVAGTSKLRQDTAVTLAADPAAIHLFDSVSGNGI